MCRLLTDAFLIALLFAYGGSALVAAVVASLHLGQMKEEENLVADSAQCTRIEEKAIAERVLFFEIVLAKDDEKEIDSLKALLEDFDKTFWNIAGVDSSFFDHKASKVKIELQPKKAANLDHASLTGGATRDGHGKFRYEGIIQMAGPTAHDGKSLSTSGHRKDRRYFDKLLIHEVSAIYLDLFAKHHETEFYRCPSWFREGAEEYLGVYHSTPYWRKEGVRCYHERLKSNPHSIDADFGINLSDPYNDGFLLLDFMRSEFDEKVIFKIIASREASFGKRLRTSIGVEFGEFVKRFEAW